MARAMWKAVLSFGGVELPVKLYAAVEDRKVHFNLLSPGTGERVRQRMVDPDSGEEVAPEETRKGLEVEPGRFVVLEDEELEELRPEPSRTIEVGRFVDRGEIDHRWYERPYYLGPDDGAASEDDYFALAAALAKRGEEGVARWVLRNKAYAGSLHERDGYLMLVTLRGADEVIPAGELEPPGGPAPSKRERDMANQLVAAYEDEFDPAEFHDEYREKLRELVEAKAEGATVKLRKLRPKKPTESLAGALEKSLAAAKKRQAEAAGGRSRG